LFVIEFNLPAYISVKYSKHYHRWSNLEPFNVVGFEYSLSTEEEDNHYSTQELSNRCIHPWQW